MIRSMLLALGAALALPPGGHAQDKLEPLPDAFEMVFMRDSGPVFIRLEARIGDQPVQARFREYLKKWFAFLDTDRDGKLNSQEVAGGPKAATLTQALRNGAFFNQPMGSLTLADLKKGPQETATLEDFLLYFQRNNVQGLQVTPSFRGAQFADQPGAVLLKVLDRDKDGRLSREELSGALEAVRKFDLDDDELIASVELAPASQPNILRPPPPLMVKPAQADTTLMSFYPLNSLGDRDRLPLILLSHYDKNENTTLSRNECGFDVRTFTRLDKNTDRELDLDELAEWIKGPADFDFVLETAMRGDEASLNVKHVLGRYEKAQTRTSGISSLIKLDDAEITVQGRQTNFSRLEPREMYMEPFRMADKDERGYVEVADLGTPRGRLLQIIFPMVDRDGDGKMTLAEVTRFSDLQADLPRCQASLSIIEQGRALFQLLDVNRDSQLSIHELRSAWSRLEPLDAEKKGFVAIQQIPRQFQIVAMPGSSQVIFGAVSFSGDPAQPQVRSQLPRTAPEWFRKMDINSDGFLSPREFLGSRDDFNRIDGDRNGLLDPQEAERFDATVRPKQRR